VRAGLCAATVAAATVVANLVGVLPDGLGSSLATARAAAAPTFDLPVFRTQVPAGGGTTVELKPAFDPPRTKVDADPASWRGVLPGYGGAMDYSHGELVYEDHIFDAWGPDNGQNTARLKVLNPLTATLPEFYRLDPAYQYLPGEFGIPTGPLTPSTNYGEDPYEAQADLSQVRLATDARRNLWMLARTTTMDDRNPATALLVLLDTHPGSTRPANSPTTTYKVPFNSGLTTARGDIAVFLHGSYGAWVDLRHPTEIHRLPLGSVATNAKGYTNAIEAKLPAFLLQGATRRVGIAVAAGLADKSGIQLASLPLQPNVANVAFRTDEPARNWFDEDQALELYKGTIDEFFTTADLSRMAAGANQRYVPGPGYHERIFTSSRAISQEGGMDGILQHYGVYLPTTYRAGNPTPTQYWFHFRGGDANIAAAVVPGVFWDMGEAENSIVITPDGRGQEGWYVGKSQEDVLEVWRDSHRLYSIDRNRTYIAGHSMGGWASYLLPIEHPDWFAAAFPASGPPTQGAFTGAPGCSAASSNSDGACFIQANGGDAQAEYTEPLLGNLKWVPYAIYQGTNDELVPPPGVVVQADRFRQLGYRYRLYLFPGQEHYGPPIVDQWTDGAQYEHEFVRDPNPPEVVYTRSMAFEHAIETVNSDHVKFSFPLNQAYWMSGLEPVNPTTGTASVDARSLAIAAPPHSLVPEAGGPATATQAYPYTMVGQAWQDDPSATPAVSNAFTATLAGARAVTFDTGRMGLTSRLALTGTVTTGSPLALTLLGSWSRSVTATLDGHAVPVQMAARRLSIEIPAGSHRLTVT
jgi:S-formylglutathione hydrolase FrmB